MALPTLDQSLDIIAKLDDEPNDVGGLTAAELKARFDLAGNIIKDYINGTLLSAIAGAEGLTAAGITGVQSVLASSTTEIPNAKAVADAIQAAGGGDMMAAVYDTDADGRVNAADEASKLSTPRTISLTGGVTGSASFDGSANVAIPVDSVSAGNLAGTVPVNKGGTGGTSAAAGLYNLIHALTSVTLASTDRIPFSDESGSKAAYATLSNLFDALVSLGLYKAGGTDVAVEDGGTGASTPAAARTNLGITPANIGAAASSHNHGAGDIDSGTLAIARGGTGGATAAAARSSLGITPANIGAVAKRTSLWTNSAMNSSFAAQTLTISGLSDYNYFLIAFKTPRTSSDTKRATFGAWAWNTNSLEMAATMEFVDSGMVSTIHERDVTFDLANNKITFSTAWKTGGSSSGDNSLMIPLYIIGFDIT